MNGPPQIFDRKVYAGRRARAARMAEPSFLAEDAARGIAERLAAVNRSFAQALDLGFRPESHAILAPFATHWTDAALHGEYAGVARADEEALPFAAQSFDLVVSVLSLHAVNDLPGTLIQIRRVLKPDGLFLAALFGGGTLKELRAALAGAESEIAGGASPRVAPFADVRDLGGLLQRAGFALPVADIERTTARYRDLLTLVRDLRALGETNALAERVRTPLSRRVLTAAMARHARDGERLSTTFDIVYLTGWAPHESQQKPLRPGSAKARLADALGVEENSAGDKAGPAGRSAEAGHDRIEEREHVGAEQLQDAKDHDRETGRDHRIFDGRGAGTVARKP